MGRNRGYSKEEKDYIFDNWGNVSLREMAGKMKQRTPKGIVEKAKRLKLRGISKSGESMTISQISKLLGVDRKTIKNKWAGAGLKVRQRILKNKKIYLLVKYNDLLEWLEKNPSLWDSRKLGFYALSVEPDWLVDKRNRDNNSRDRVYQRYTDKEDDQIWHLYVKGYSPVQIAELTGRSKFSVERRLERIRNKKTGSGIRQTQ